MKKLIVLILVMLSLAMPSIASGNDPGKIPVDPLTPAQAEKWMRSIAVDELVKYVIGWDLIERSIPEITAPKMVAALTESGDLYVSWSGPFDILIGQEKTAALHYKVLFPDAVVRNFHVEEKKSFLAELKDGVLIFLAGAATAAASYGAYRIFR